MGRVSWQNRDQRHSGSFAQRTRIQAGKPVAAAVPPVNFILPAVRLSRAHSRVPLVNRANLRVVPALQFCRCPPVTLRAMTDQAENRFDSIESAHEYLDVLAGVLADTQAVIQDDISTARRERPDSRQVDALQLVDYKLQRLGEHLRSSRRLLNDLRTLRRLLNGDRTPERVAAAARR
jgi:hypothetical protein